MQTVSVGAPGGAAYLIKSAILGLFIMYDDDPQNPGLLPAMTGTYLASNASFGFTPVLLGGKIVALKLTMNGPTGTHAFFKAFFPTKVTSKFFGPSCGFIPTPSVVPKSGLVSGPSVFTHPMGCELVVNVIFASPVTVEIPLPTVTVDIKPGTLPNSINPSSRGVLPVAILTTDRLDATTVDPTTVRFGAEGSEAAPGRFKLEDIDGDGKLDLLLHFNTLDTGIACGTTSATLTGTTLRSEAIVGFDSVETVGCGGRPVRPRS
jgi:hypothetical protein